MTSMQGYYEQAEVPNWLDAVSGDNRSIDRSPSGGHHPPQYPPPGPAISVRTTPISPVIAMFLSRSTNSLKLEHKLPAARLLGKSSLRRLYDQISQHDPRRTFTEFRNEEDSVSLATTATDSEYENCFLPSCGALPPQSGESFATTSTSPSPSPLPPTNHEPQWLPLVAARLISSKARKAYRSLKKMKFSR
ncbi:hypothetical protein N7537_011127 [Penicillium hordei]|uniref:Uncharacterized protein n=1 Tax=Penicillium hordei TaxID=40994 RepID=A0AAD6GUF0_9EURO|nr:uncharacterized protein N7537_011127 [Penicillium hordei]KAJ5588449.1 hypothetical protein N7537_011127 [Penicillium hordei]